MAQINATDINPTTGKQYGIDPATGIWNDETFDKTYGAANRADNAQQASLNAPVAQAQQNKTDLQNLFASQEGQTSDFLKRYTGAINGQEGTSAMAARIGQELGVPQLQANAQSLNQTLFNLPATYSAATTGRDVNANQLARIVGTKQAELSPAAALATQNAQTAQTNLNTRLGYEQTDQQKALLPYQTEQQLLTDRLSRETTGYTQQMQSELDAIIAKMNAGVTLSEGEKSRAQELALSEQNYKQQLGLQQNSQQFTASQPNTQIITVGGVQKLINSVTGQVIQTLGAAAAPATGATTGNVLNYLQTGSSGRYSVLP